MNKIIFGAIAVLFILTSFNTDYASVQINKKSSEKLLKSDIRLLEKFTLGAKYSGETYSEDDYKKATSAYLAALKEMYRTNSLSDKQHAAGTARLIVAFGKEVEKRKGLGGFYKKYKRNLVPEILQGNFLLIFHQLKIGEIDGSFPGKLKEEIIKNAESGLALHKLRFSDEIYQ